MAMGLTSSPAADWIELDDLYVAEMAERRALLADRHGEVFAALPVSDDARQEVLATSWNSPAGWCRRICA